MKKIFAMSLALVMLACCCAMAEAADLVGSWYLNSVEYNGASVHPSALGLEMTITLKDAGKAEVAMQEGVDVMQGEWSVNGSTVTVTIDGEPQAFEFDGENLVADEPTTGIKMILGRVKEEMVVEEVAPVRTGVTVADFNGTWAATEVNMMDMLYSVEALGMGMTVELKDGAASVTETQGDVVTTYGATVSLEDDVLTVAGENSADSESVLYLQLHEDDRLSFSQSVEGFSMTIYFERAE